MVTEKRLIASFIRAFRSPPAPAGPGDDAALLIPRLSSTTAGLCVTTDAVVEGVHFTRSHFSPADVGHKALAVNLSDLAAMGAKPAWFVCSLIVPRSLPVAAWIQGLAAGMAPLARAHGIQLIGGNFSAGRDLSVTLTCAGHVPAEQALLRSRGRPGDILYISGTLGDARLGLRQLRSGLRRGPAISRQKRPTPRIALGLVARRFAHAGMDVSDGLARDLTELCHRSGAGASLELSTLPVSAALRAAVPGPLARGLFALQGGEDYELLLAVPPARAAAFERACARRRLTITRVGELTRSRALRCTLQGMHVPTPPGFDHFA